MIKPSPAGRHPKGEDPRPLKVYKYNIVTDKMDNPSGFKGFDSGDQEYYYS